MPLTDVQVRNTRPSQKPQKIFDGDGLFLLVATNGSRGWRFKYRFEGREKMISFGTYPEVPLKLARERRDAARALVATGVDPSAERKAKRAAREDTFQSIALEWLQMQEKSLGAKTFKKKTERLTTFVFPYDGPLWRSDRAQVHVGYVVVDHGCRDVPHRVRYSGASLGCQIGSILGGGLAPTVAAVLFAATGTSLATSLYVAGVCLLGFTAMALRPETYRVSLDVREAAEISASGS